MGARVVVIIEVTGQDSTQVAFAEDEDVVETLAPDRAEGVPRKDFATGCCRRS
jgi:hypothetical protein